MTTFFVLLHRYKIFEDIDDTKVIGIFSNMEKAKAALENVKDKLGFRDHPDCFQIEPWTLDTVHWKGSDPTGARR